MPEKMKLMQQRGVCLGLLGILLVVFWVGGAFASQESEILLARGNKYYLDGNYVQAQNELRQAAALDPSNPEIRMLLGVTYFASKDYPQAEVEFSEATRIDPNVPRGKFYLGATSFNLGKYSEAERLLKEAQAQNPQDALVPYYLSLVSSHQNRPEEARTQFNNAATLAPEFMGPFQIYEQGLPRAGRDGQDKAFNISFYTGMEYDDNFKILPYQITLPYGGSYPGGKGTWRVPIVLETNIRPFRKDNWEAGLDYFFYSGNNFTIDNFNFLTNRADIYVKYTNGPFTVRPWYGVDFALKALERYSFFNNAGLASSWQWNSLTTTDLIYRFQDRSFRYPTAPAYDRTGYVNEVGIFQTFYFGNQAAWRLGGTFARELTQGSNWDNKNFSFITDTSINLPYSVNLWGYFQYGRYNFDNVDTFANVRQHQNYYQVSVQLRRPLTNYLDIVAGYTHVSQRSNIVDFTYDRNLYQLLLNARY
jgi:tetratricopeptide (TPR) repeat protein